MTTLRPSIAGAAFALTAAVAAASGGVFRGTKHGDPATGVQRLESEPRGDCAQCHDQHASRDGSATGGPFPFLLFAANDNALCGTCHGPEGAHGVYPGLAPWEASSHAASSQVVWPGPNPPARPNADAGKCVNCHDPHGARDAAGPVPSLTAVREEDLCLPCHDGNPAPDVQTQFRRPFAHPITTDGRHDASEGSAAGRHGTGNRHAECADCHNPHRGTADPAPPTAPAVSQRLFGVSRVRVTNGVAGTTPIYTWAGPGETAFASEYEICFKCHSSWTTLPAGKPDLALLLNPSNPSYHPVEATGRNRNIDPLSFANNWRWDRLTYCSDCHASDDPLVKGPHGSNYRSLLKGGYAASSLEAPMAPTDVCFECHAWETYADRRGSAAVQAASRFNPPGESRGHAFHVGQRDQPCYACHQSHGSTQYPALIAVGRVPGLSAYTQTASGGTCTPTCHQPRSYTVSYPR